MNKVADELIYHNGGVLLYGYVLGLGMLTEEILTIKFSKLFVAEAAYVSNEAFHFNPKGCFNSC